MKIENDKIIFSEEEKAQFNNKLAYAFVTGVEKAGTLLLDNINDYLRQGAKALEEFICERGITRKKLKEIDFYCFYYCFPFLNTKGFDTEELEKGLIQFALTNEFEEQILEGMHNNLYLQKRIEFIRECLCEFRNGKYLSSALIAASQVEGVITDMLDAKGLCIEKNGRLFQTNESGEIVQNKKGGDKFLSGISVKNDVLKGSFKRGDQDLFIDLFDDNFSGSTVNGFRNALMHGSAPSYPSEKDTLKLICWFYGLVSVFKTIRYQL